MASEASWKETPSPERLLQTYRQQMLQSPYLIAEKVPPKIRQVPSPTYSALSVSAWYSALYLRSSASSAFRFARSASWLVN